MDPKRLAEEALTSGSVVVPEDQLEVVREALYERLGHAPLVENLGNSHRIYARGGTVELFADHIRKELDFWYNTKGSGIRLCLVEDGAGTDRRWTIRAEGQGGLTGDTVYPNSEGVADQDLDKLISSLDSPEFEHFEARVRGDLARRILPRVESAIDEGDSVSKLAEQAWHLKRLIRSANIDRIDEFKDDLRPRYPELHLTFARDGASIPGYGLDTWMFFACEYEGGPPSEIFFEGKEDELEHLLASIEQQEIERWAASIKEQRVRAQRPASRTL